MALQFNIGCSGFYNRHWKGVFYPEKLPQRKWFEYYCEYFNTLELNTTFYKFPTAEKLQEWHKKSPDDFLFSVKAPRLITHYKQFNDCERLLNDFYLACDKGLDTKLGCTLFQFPPSMQYSEAKLEQIVKGLHPAHKNVIEFRHESWWKKAVYDELAANGITFCTVSHPKMPETVIANTGTGYVRLHGVPRMFYSDYTDEQLKQLKQNLMKKRRLKEVYIFFNNTADIAGIQNAQTMKKLVKPV